MNALRIGLLIALIAIVGTLAGCHEGSARRNNLIETREVAFEPSVTGFWQANLVYAGAD
ncbi:MAG: hypothetical protein PVJ86_02605 [Phycisphaerales bacterium]